MRRTARAYGGGISFIFLRIRARLRRGSLLPVSAYKHRTLGELVELPAGRRRRSLPLNFGMAALTGLLWYGQFFFYNLGHVRMGTYKFTSWAMHMIMLVLFSNLVAFCFANGRVVAVHARWPSRWPWPVLPGGDRCLLTYGNYLGRQAYAT